MFIADDDRMPYEKDAGLLALRRRLEEERHHSYRRVYGNAEEIIPSHSEYTNMVEMDIGALYVYNKRLQGIDCL